MPWQSVGNVSAWPPWAKFGRGPFTHSTLILASRSETMGSNHTSHISLISSTCCSESGWTFNKRSSIYPYDKIKGLTRTSPSSGSSPSFIHVT